MRIKKGFLLRRVGTQNIAAAAGSEAKSFNGIIRLNETGRFLWEKLADECTQEELVGALTGAFSVSKEQAERDVSAFLDELKSAGLLAETK